MTKLKKSSKNIPNYCKLQIIFKNEARLRNNFHFKDGIPKVFISDAIYKFQYELPDECYHGECARHME